MMGIYSSTLKIIDEAKKYWDKIDYEVHETSKEFHEANLLLLDNTKALKELKWNPQLTIKDSVQMSVEWYKSYFLEQQNLMFNQITKYLNTNNPL